MKKIQKNLKEASIVVLIFTALSFIRMAVQLFFIDFDMEGVTDGLTKGIAQATLIVLSVVSFALLLPQLYVGIKGLKVAKNPDSSKAHIVWAIILLGLTIVGVPSTVSDMIQTGEIAGNLLELADALLDVLVYGAFIKFATAVLKGE